MVILLLFALALLSWPQGAVRLEPSGPVDPSTPGTTGVRRLSPTQLVAGVTVVAVAAISKTDSVLVGLSAGLVLGTGALLIRSELRSRRERLDIGELLAGTRTLAREVRTGSAPAAAIISSAAAHHGVSAQMLDALAIGVAGDRSGRGSGPVTSGGQAADVTARLLTCWSLAVRYGVPWAALIETVAVDLADQATAKSQRSAEVSGPRVSGYVLAVMPALGAALGVGMGADPVHVLLGTAAGHLMLFLGCVLTCIGLAWTARIVEG